MSVRASMLAAAGIALLAVGSIGIVLPLLPATPFFIAAAACFSRSSPRFELWLVTHPKFGHLIRGWRRSRAIPTRTKVVAMVTMVTGFAVFVLSGGAPLALQGTVAAILACCAIFIVSRPAR